jgi:hypothetical protein
VLHILFRIHVSILHQQISWVCECRPVYYYVFAVFTTLFFTVNYALCLNLTILCLNKHRFFKIRLYQSAHRWPRAIKFNSHHLVLWSFSGLSQWVYSIWFIMNSVLKLNTHFTMSYKCECRPVYYYVFAVFTTLFFTVNYALCLNLTILCLNKLSYDVHAVNNSIIHRWLFVCILVEYLRFQNHMQLKIFSRLFS